MAVDSLASTLDLYQDVQKMVVGSLVIAIGWLLTVDKTRRYLRQQKTLGCVVAGVFLVGAIGHLILVWKNLYAESQALMDLLRQQHSDVLLPEYYKTYEIDALTFVMHMAINQALFLLFIVLVLVACYSKKGVSRE
ncbi:MAG: hypothetical protein AAFX79_13540 [Planctomycetota bacterium]